MKIYNPTPVSKVGEIVLKMCTFGGEDIHPPFNSFSYHFVRDSLVDNKIWFLLADVEMAEVEENENMETVH